MPRPSKHAEAPSRPPRIRRTCSQRRPEAGRLAGAHVDAKLPPLRAHDSNGGPLLWAVRKDVRRRRSAHRPRRHRGSSLDRLARGSEARGWIRARRADPRELATGSRDARRGERGDRSAASRPSSHARHAGSSLGDRRRARRAHEVHGAATARCSCSCSWPGPARARVGPSVHSSRSRTWSARWKHAASREARVSRATRTSCARPGRLAPGRPAPGCLPPAPHHARRRHAGNRSARRQRTRT